MPISPLTSKATAYHEAGHATVAWFAGRAPRIVTTLRTDGATGSCTWSARRRFQLEWDGSPRLQRICEDEIRAFLAGHFAEVKYRRQQGMSAATSHSWESDRTKAELLASYINGNPAQISAYLRWLLLGAQQRVELEWHVIRALAAQLVKLKTINGRDAYQIMLRASIGH